MTSVKNIAYAVLLLIAVVGASALFYSCGKRSSSSQVADLTTQLAQSEQTVNLKDGLYATAAQQLSNLQSLLNGDDKSIADLKKQLAATNAQLLSTEQVALQWKQDYETQLAANQSQQGDRTRVDFAGDLGPIHATGYTLTDPAEAHLTLHQQRPVLLTVSVAKTPDGKWQSYVTSSEPNMDVKVNLAGVDPGVTSPTWKQRIWLDLGTDFLGDKSASIGLSYHFDRFSVGTSCSIWEGGYYGCGVNVGIRLFN